MDFCTGDREHTISLYRDPLFDKCLDELRAKGGEALVIAGRVDEFIDIYLRPDKKGDRQKFRFTRNSEARIKNCKKVDLGCGYRLVCIKKDGHLALLFVGTHDDCFRWIGRNRGMKYDVSASNAAGRAVRKNIPAQEMPRGPVSVEQTLPEAYEASLMGRMNDDVLRKVFSGLCQTQSMSENRKNS